MKNQIVIFNRHAELPAEHTHALCQRFIVLDFNCPQTDCSLHRTLFPANGMLRGLCSRPSAGGGADPTCWYLFSKDAQALAILIYISTQDIGAGIRKPFK